MKRYFVQQMTLLTLLSTLSSYAFGMNGFCGGYEAGLYSGCAFRFLIEQKTSKLHVSRSCHSQREREESFPQHYQGKSIVEESFVWRNPFVDTKHSQKQLKLRERLPTICELCTGGKDGFPLRGHMASRCPKRFDAVWQAYVDAKLNVNTIDTESGLITVLLKKCFCFGS